MIDMKFEEEKSNLIGHCWFDCVQIVQEKSQHKPRAEIALHAAPEAPWSFWAPTGALYVIWLLGSGSATTKFNLTFPKLTNSLQNIIYVHIAPIPGGISFFAFFTQPNTTVTKESLMITTTVSLQLKATHTTQNNACSLINVTAKCQSCFWKIIFCWDEFTQECWNQFISASITPLRQHQRETSFKTKCVKVPLKRRNSPAWDENWKIKTSKRKFCKTLFDTQGN